jgi:hypothetical protein
MVNIGRRETKRLRRLWDAEFTVLAATTFHPDVDGPPFFVLADGRCGYYVPSLTGLGLSGLRTATARAIAAHEA